MVKKIAVLVSLSILLYGCATVGSLVGVNTIGEKRIAKEIINTKISDTEINDFDISDSYKEYIKSPEGRQYYENVRDEMGSLEKMKILAVVKPSNDTLIHVFKGYFENAETNSKVEITRITNEGIVKIEVRPMWMSN